MQKVRIYQPPKTPMQSGLANTRQWVLEYEPGERRRPEPLMGWTSSGDTRAQVRLRFPSKEEALRYAKRHGLAARVEEPRGRILRPKNYSDNFAYNRML